MKIWSDDFEHGATLDASHAMAARFGFGCAGDNVSPHLAWSDAPEGTTSFALLCHDPDAPTGGAGFWHWIVADIPPDVSALARGAGSDGGTLPTGAIHVGVDTGEPGYAGPCPPEGDPPHAYNFTLYAVGPDGINVTPETPASQVGFQLHFASLERVTIRGHFAR